MNINTKFLFLLLSCGTIFFHTSKTNAQDKSLITTDDHCLIDQIFITETVADEKGLIISGNIILDPLFPALTPVSVTVQNGQDGTFIHSDGTFTLQTTEPQPTLNFAINCLYGLRTVGMGMQITQINLPEENTLAEDAVLELDDWDGQLMIDPIAYGYFGVSFANLVLADTEAIKEDGIYKNVLQQPEPNNKHAVIAINTKNPDQVHTATRKDKTFLFAHNLRYGTYDIYLVKRKHFNDFIQRIKQPDRVSIKLIDTENNIWQKSNQ
ncbi:MAG: hypothetical protein R3A45_02230 [Bdellovibrionota bacterium]